MATSAFKILSEIFKKRKSDLFSNGYTVKHIQDVFVRELHDLPDIVNLIRANNYNYRTEHFRQLCEKFGNLLCMVKF